MPSVPRAASRGAYASEPGDIHSRAVAKGEPIPIIGGTGALGAGLALRWARAGRAVVIGSRSAERAAEAAAKLREDVPGVEVQVFLNVESAKRDDVLHTTVPFRAQSENSDIFCEALQPGQIL